MNDDKHIFAKRLKDIRLYRGYTQGDLAQKVQCTNKNISAYENGVRTPNYDMLVALAKALRCSTDYLLGIVDEPNRFTGDVDGSHHEVVIADKETDKPYTRQDFQTLVRKLQSIGIDVDEVMGKK